MFAGITFLVCGFVFRCDACAVHVISWLREVCQLARTSELSFEAMSCGQRCVCGGGCEASLCQDLCTICRILADIT